jgi:hypothetical protein
VSQKIWLPICAEPEAGKVRDSSKKNGDGSHHGTIAAAHSIAQSATI